MLLVSLMFEMWIVTFEPAGAVVRVSINKLYPVPKRIGSGLPLRRAQNGGGLGISKSLPCSLILSCLDHPQFPWCRFYRIHKKSCVLPDAILQTTPSLFSFAILEVSREIREIKVFRKFHIIVISCYMTELLQVNIRTSFLYLSNPHVANKDLVLLVLLVIKQKWKGLTVAPSTLWEAFWVSSFPARPLYIIIEIYTLFLHHSVLYLE